MLNNRGPKTDPWGTPCVTLFQELNDPFTFLFLFFYFNLFIHGSPVSPIGLLFRGPCPKTTDKKLHLNYKIYKNKNFD